MGRKKKRSKKDYNYFGVRPEDIDRIRVLCPLNQYRIVSPNVLRPLKIFSPSLLDKMDSVLLVASGSSDSEVYYVLNGNRGDIKANAVDQMPFAFFCSGSTPLTSGSLTQHGDWPGRTYEDPPEAFWTHLSSSGISKWFPLQELPTNESGSIDELEISSQWGAFNDSIGHLKKKFGI